MLHKMSADILQYLRETPAAVEVIAWTFTLLLAGVLVRVVMGKQIRERKRYVQYNRKIERNMRIGTCSHLTYSETIPHSKPIRLSAIVLMIGLVLVALSLYVMHIAVFVSGGGWYETFGGRLFGPLLGGTILLLLLALCVFAIWAFCKLLKRRGRNEKIPMRIRVIKCKGGR